MKRKCPNKNCHYYQLPDFIIKDGFFFRKNDSRKIQRYKCKNCKIKFSNSSGSLEFAQKKRRINHKLYKLLGSKISQRRAALILGVNKNTIARKVKYLGEKYRRENAKQLSKKREVTHLQIDDLITKEKTKLKPVSISLAVDGETGAILGAEVSQIPSFGHLSKLSKKKYGFRKCHHRKGLENLFEKITPSINSYAQIRSDEHAKYPEFIQKYLPHSNHQTFKSERACVVGQGELKKVRYDPLFKVNHACAMMRDGISTLVRKTWSVTQKLERLRDLVEIFIHYFNNVLITKRKRNPI